MTISILTLFPDMFAGPFDYSILKRAQKDNIVKIQLFNIRDVTTDAYHTVDDSPYGGGNGMILKVDVVDKALKSIKASVNPGVGKKYKQLAVLLTPQGKRYTQKIVKQLAAVDHLILVCGHYEGIDERIRDLVDMEISIGDYILTGGEIPAMVVVDSVTRLLPGMFAKTGVTDDESFGDNGLLEYPQYTKPQTYDGDNVPEVLLSGDHKKITAWRSNQARIRTAKRRPDILI